MITQIEIDLLRQQIGSFVRHANSEAGDNGPYSGGDILDAETRSKVTDAIVNFVHCATLKFIKGQKEHEGRLQDRNLDKEMYLEIIDLFFYNAAKDWK